MLRTEIHPNSTLKMSSFAHKTSQKFMTTSGQAARNPAWSTHHLKRLLFPNKWENPFKLSKVSMKSMIFKLVR